MRTRRLFSFALCLLLCLPCAAFAQNMTVNKIAAVVNGEMISLHELRMNTASELARLNIKPDSPEAAKVQQNVLEIIINNILIRQEAKRFNITVTDTEVREELEQIQARSGMSQAQFDTELKRQRTTRAAYEERLRNSLLRQRMSHYMIDRKIFVTREQIAEYYAKHKDEFGGEKNADFSIMILPASVSPQEVYKQVTSGTLSFEDAAKKYSVDGSAQKGGMLRNVPWNRLPKDMQNLLTSLKDTQISPMMKAGDGFIVIRRDALNEARPLTLQEAHPRIEEILRAPLRETRFNEYTQQLREKAVIDVRI